MSCTNPKDCRPCEGCLPTEPIRPHCDVILDDGVYTNATVIVQGGCIVRVQEGQLPVYDVAPCSSSPGGGAPVQPPPCNCPPGADGESATISVGAVHSVAPSAPARVVNTGSLTHANLAFYIPRGMDGQDGEGATGVTDNRGNIEIEEGLIKSLPPTWPPVLNIKTVVKPTGSVMNLMAGPVNSEGELELTFDDGGLISGLETQMAAIESTVNQHLDGFGIKLRQLETVIRELIGSTNDRFEDLIDCTNEKFDIVCEDLHTLADELGSEVELICQEADDCRDEPFFHEYIQ